VSNNFIKIKSSIYKWARVLLQNKFMTVSTLSMYPRYTELEMVAIDSQVVENRKVFGAGLLLGLTVGGAMIVLRKVCTIRGKSLLARQMIQSGTEEGGKIALSPDAATGGSLVVLGQLAKKYVGYRVIYFLGFVSGVLVTIAGVMLYSELEYRYFLNGYYF